MPVISVRVTQDGFQVSPEMASQLGLSPGEEARLEIRKIIDADAARDRALHFAWRSLGDALGVGEPAWTGEFWVVPLKLRSTPESVGQVAVSPDGEILTEQSTSRGEVLERVDAARPHPAATG
jgi:hypothetical protein